MTGERLKNLQWTVTARPDGYYSHDSVHTAILQDIRDELQKLNALLHCHNFTGIPHSLTQIVKNTKKKRKRVPPKLKAVAGGKR